MDRRNFLQSSALATALGAAPGLALWGSAVQASSARPLIWCSTIPQTLDPHDVVDVPSFFIKNNVYDTLYEYVYEDDTSTVPSLKMRLVEGAQSSDDGLVWDFTIRENIQFHDGRVMDAEDVHYSFRRALSLRTAVTSVFSGFMDADSVEVTGPRSVRVTLRQAYAPFLTVLPVLPIVNRQVVEANTKDGDWGKAFLTSNSAGSGPYKLVPGSFAPVDRFDLEWFEPYFRGWPNPQPMHTVLGRYIKSNTTRMLALQKGDIDITDGYIAADQFERLRQAPGVELSLEPSLRTYLIRFNNQRAPFNNINYRKAISYAFPYDLFIDKVLRGNATRNLGPIPGPLWGNPQDLKGYDYDLDKAREHLELAAKDGVDIKQDIEFFAVATYDETAMAGQLLQSELRKIGVPLKVSKLGWANLLSLCQKVETTPQLWSHWTTPYYVDPDNWMGPYYTTASHGTSRGANWYDNPQVEELLNEANRLPDQAQRQALYEKASRQIVDEAVDLWIYTGKLARGVRTRLKGYQRAAVGDGVDMRLISIDET